MLRFTFLPAFLIFLATNCAAVSALPVAVPAGDSWPLLYFVFNENYYAATVCAEYHAAECPMVNGTGKAGLNVFEHFRNQSQHHCVQPDRFFEDPNLGDFLDVDRETAKPCSMAPLLDVAIDEVPASSNFTTLLDLYAGYIYDGVLPSAAGDPHHQQASALFGQKLRAFAQRGCVWVAKLARLLGRSELLDTILLPVLNEFRQCSIGGEAVLAAQAMVTTVSTDVHRDGKTPPPCFRFSLAIELTACLIAASFQYLAYVGYFQLLSNHAAHHSTTPSHIEFILDLLSLYHTVEPKAVAGAMNVLAFDLFSAGQATARDYSAAVYKEYDDLIQHLHAESLHNSLVFLATGAADEVHAPQHDICLQLLLREVVALPRSNVTSGHIYVRALLLGMQAHLRREPVRVSATLVEQVATALTAHNVAPATLLNHLTGAYHRTLSAAGGQWHESIHAGKSLDVQS
jgi:hypothetical protein